MFAIISRDACTKIWKSRLLYKGKKDLVSGLYEIHSSRPLLAKVSEEPRTRALARYSLNHSLSFALWGHTIIALFRLEKMFKIITSNIMVISHYFPSRLSLSVAETGRKTLFCRNVVAFLPFLASNYLNILWLIIFFFLIPRRMCHENIILRLLISKTFFLNSSMSKIQCKILSGEGGIAAMVEKPLVWF